VTPAPLASDSAPGQPTPEVAQAAERHGLGGLRRIIELRKVRLLGKGEVESRYFEFADGLIYQGPDGHVHVYPWEKVSRINLTSTGNYFNGRYVNTGYSFVLVLGNGGYLTRTGFFVDPALWRGGVTGKKRVAGDEQYELFTLISGASHTVSLLLLPDALARLERGEELPFGDVRISRAGVRADDRLITWDSIKDVQVKNGIARFRAAVTFQSLSHQEVGAIPNLPLFFMLVKALTSGAPDKA
jgi:hypothetical protein